VGGAAFGNSSGGSARQHHRLCSRWGTPCVNPPFGPTTTSSNAGSSAKAKT